ncbi:pantetheine-phosphate adenylyltransferase [Bacteroidales bacterium]|nr:pantetheine-phosphate adenylyltransferase [Bacteroidales bacterium]
MKKIALFPGTFDPFTLGHESIVERGLNLVDELIIAIGINTNKKTHFSLEQRLEMLENLYANEPRIKVQTYNCLTLDFASQVGAKFILRGIRSMNDFEFEKSIADVNHCISKIETLVLFTKPKFIHISSSIVRELLTFEKNVDEFVPKKLNIYKYLIK